MAVAYNPTTGEAVFWNGTDWAPATVASNPKTGEKVAWDGTNWSPIGTPAPQTSVLSDLGQFAKRGVGEAIGQVGYLANRLPGDYGTGMEKYGEEMAASADQAISPEAKERAARPYVTETEPGKGTFGTSYQFNPSAIAGIPYQAAEMAPGAAAGIGAGLLAGSGAVAASPVEATAGLGLLALRVLGPLGESTAAKMLGTAGVAAARQSGASLLESAAPAVGQLLLRTLPADAIMGLQMGAMTGQATEKQITQQLQANPDQLTKTPEGVAALAKTNGNVEEAIKIVAESTSGTAALRGGVLGALAGVPGKLFEAGVVQQGFTRGALSDAAKGAAIEGISGAGIGAGQQYVGNIAAMPYTPGLTPGKDVLNSAIQMGVLSSGIGGGLGAFRGATKGRDITPEEYDRALQIANDANLLRDIQTYRQSEDVNIRARGEQLAQQFAEAQRIIALPPPPRPGEGPAIVPPSRPEDISIASPLSGLDARQVINWAETNADRYPSFRSILDAPLDINDKAKALYDAEVDWSSKYASKSPEELAAIRERELRAKQEETARTLEAAGESQATKYPRRYDDVRETPEWQEFHGKWQELHGNYSDVAGDVIDYSDPVYKDIAGNPKLKGAIKNKALADLAAQRRADFQQKRSDLEQKRSEILDAFDARRKVEPEAGDRQTLAAASDFQKYPTGLPSDEGNAYSPTLINYLQSIPVGDRPLTQTVQEILGRNVSQRDAASAIAAHSDGRGLNLFDANGNRSDVRTGGPEANRDVSNPLRPAEPAVETAAPRKTDLDVTQPGTRTFEEPTPEPDLTDAEIARKYITENVGPGGSITPDKVGFEAGVPLSAAKDELEGHVFGPTASTQVLRQGRAFNLVRDGRGGYTRPEEVSKGKFKGARKGTADARSPEQRVQDYIRSLPDKRIAYVDDIAKATKADRSTIERELEAHTYDPQRTNIAGSLSSDRPKLLTRTADGRYVRSSLFEASEAASPAEERILRTPNLGTKEQVAPSSKESLTAERIAEARKNIGSKLRELRAMGKGGNELANSLVRALKNRELTDQQVVHAFATSDIMAKLLGVTGAAPRIEFMTKLLHPEDATKEVGGLAMRDLIQISMDNKFLDNIRETGAHEAFHLLQDIMIAHDPKSASLLFGKRVGTDAYGRGIYEGGAFKDGMKLSDVPTDIKRALQSASPTQGGETYWQRLEKMFGKDGRFKEAFTTQREAMAYVFGSLADAKMRGYSNAGLLPMSKRFTNFAAGVMTRLRNLLRGEGYRNANDVLSEYATGKAQRGLEAAPELNGRPEFAWTGERGTTWPKKVQKTAEDMEANGEHPDEIYFATGLHRGKGDGKWRQEVPDVNAKIWAGVLEDTFVDYDDQGNFQDYDRNAEVPLKDAYDHKDIYYEYPFLRDYKIKLLSEEQESRMGGYHDEANKIIGISSDKLASFLNHARARPIGAARAKDPLDKILTHEIQHAIQSHEGFALGTNPGIVVRRMKADAKKLLDSVKVFKDKVYAKIQNMSDFVRLDMFSDFKANHPDIAIDVLGFLDGSSNEIKFWKNGRHIPISDRIKLTKELVSDYDFGEIVKYRKSAETALQKAAEAEGLIVGTEAGYTESDAREHYRKNFGEQESRDTEGRLDLTTEEQRRNKLPGRMDYAPSSKSREHIFEAPYFESIMNGRALDPFARILDGYKTTIMRDVADRQAGGAKPEASVVGKEELTPSEASVVYNEPEFMPGVRARTDTPAFLRWFNKSAVRGPDISIRRTDLKTGNLKTERMVSPTPMFHAGSFDRMTESPLERGLGFMHWGTKRAALDRASAMDEAGIKAAGKNLTEAYLSIQNPKRVPDYGGDNAKWAKAVADAKAEGHDGLVYENKFEDVGKPSWVTFRPEQSKAVDNRGTWDPSKSRMEQSIAHHEPFEASTAKQAKDAMDNIERDTTGIMRRTYNKVYDALVTKWDPKGSLPMSQKYMGLMYLTRGKIAQFSESARKLYDVINTAKPEERAKVYEYLINKGAPLPAVSPKILEAAKTAKSEILKIGEDAVYKGLLTPEQLNQYKDAYLPRLYLQYMLEDGGLGGSGGFKTGDQGWRKERMNLTPEERVLKGEIKDPGFLTMAALIRPQRDMAILDFLQDVANDKEAQWVLPKSIVNWRGRNVSAFWLAKEADKLLERSLMESVPENKELMIRMATNMKKATADSFGGAEHKDYKKIPTSARYGALAGMEVRKEIYDDVVGMGSFNPDPNTWQRLFGEQNSTVSNAVNTWKATKTVYNLPSQIRQLITNAITLQLSGVPLAKVPLRITQAIDAMANNGEAWRIAKDYGVTGSGMAETELRPALEKLKSYLSGNKDGMLNPNGLRAALGKIIVDNPQKLYSLGDRVYKVAKIIDEMDKARKDGRLSTPEGRRDAERDAALEAHKYFFDYANAHPWVKSARSSPLGAPFLTYYYKMAPVLAETILKNPQRFIPWIALHYSLPLMAAAMFDVKQDDLKHLKNTLSKFQAENPDVLPLPYRDDRGKVAFADVGYLFPWQMFSGIASAFAQGDPRQAIRATGFLGNPTINVPVNIMSNVDSFTGKPIYNEFDPPNQQMGDMLNYVWGQAMPPIFTQYGAVGKLLTDHFLHNGEGVDRKGNTTLSGAELFGRAIGLNVYPTDPIHQRAQRVAQMEYDLNKTISRRTWAMRDHSRTREQLNAINQDYVNDIKQKQQAIRQYMLDTQIPDSLLPKPSTQ
jgi:hypothetical protein